MGKIIVDLPRKRREYSQCEVEHATVKVKRECYNKLVEAANETGLPIKTILEKVISDIEFRYWISDGGQRYTVQPVIDALEAEKKNKELAEALKTIVRVIGNGYMEETE